MKIWFDMDGTIADFYSVDGWLNDLQNENTRPYNEAKPLWDMNLLAERIHKEQEAGNKVGIISWTSKHSSKAFHKAVEMAKVFWLNQYLPTVHFDEIKIVRYGINKRKACGGGILFDDNDGIRADWGEGAHSPEEIFDVI